jgi:hypothetical protein
LELPISPAKAIDFLAIGMPESYTILDHVNAQIILITKYTKVEDFIEINTERLCTMNIKYVYNISKQLQLFAYLMMHLENIHR